MKENSIFCSALLKKNDFESVNGYNPNMIEGFEDWDFWIKLLHDNKQVFKIKEPLFYYRIKNNSRNSVLDYEKQLRLRKQIYHNHEEIYHTYFSIPELLYESYLLKQKHDAVLNSITYKVGKALALPINFIKKIVNKP